MKMQHLGNQGVYDEFLMGPVIQTLMSDHGIAMMVFILLGLLQLSFGIGFFTKKLDGILLLFLLIFLGGTIILMRIPFFEFFILSVLFLPQTKVYDSMKKRVFNIKTVLPQERPA